MSPDRERVAWLALCVVDEAAEKAKDGPVPPSLGLRLALGYLHSIADSPIFALPTRRYIFDQFWQTVTTTGTGTTPHQAEYTRRTMVDTCLQQIARQIRQPASIFNEIRAFRSPDVRATRELADAIKQAGRDRDDASRLKRAHYWGPPRPKRNGR